MARATYTGEIVTVRGSRTAVIRVEFEDGSEFDVDFPASKLKDVDELVIKLSPRSDEHEREIHRVVYHGG